MLGFRRLVLSKPAVIVAVSKSAGKRHCLVTITFNRAGHTVLEVPDVLDLTSRPSDHVVGIEASRLCTAWADWWYMA
jgi:hypothetical protein